MARDAIQWLESQIQRLEWKTRQIIDRNLKRTRTILRSEITSKLTKRSGALASAVGGATTRITMSGGAIVGELHLNPTPANPRGTQAIKYADTHIGKGVKIINSKGRRLAVPIPGGPAWRGKNVMYQPSTFSGPMALFHGSSVIMALKGSRNFVPTWVLKGSVSVKRRVNPQIIVDQQIKPGLLYELAKVLGEGVAP